MLCCLDSFGGSEHSSGVSAYPGRRNDLVPTGGNALAAPPAASNQQGSTGGTSKDMIKVTVPPGVSAGQPLHVNAPDGRTIQAVVPHGYGPGSSFLIELPPRAGAPSPYMHNPALPPQPRPIDYGRIEPMAPPPATSPAPARPSAPLTGPGGQALMRVQVPPGVAPGTTLHVRVPGEDRVIAAVVPPGVSEFQLAYDRLEQAPASQPFSAALSAPSATATNTSQPFSYAFNSPAPSAAASQPFSLALSNPPPTTASNQPFPAVHNSPAPGAYTAGSSQPFSAALGSSAASAPISTHQQHNPSSNEKLMLVRVPPGTVPGATLHVSIPDEPGRLVAAKVPPGVSEFHVSYVPNYQRPLAY